MKTIQTKPGVIIGFILEPKPVEPTPDSFDGKMINRYHYDEIGMYSKPDKSELIGKLSEITEEQAKELVEMTIDDTQYREVGKDGTVTNCDHKYKLRNYAESLGIRPEEFDQYLVVKL